MKKGLTHGNTTLASTSTSAKEFTEMWEQFGLRPRLGEGYHLRPADGVFQDFMKELGIFPSEAAYKAPPDPDMDWFEWQIDIYK